jgi:hypothetical protein
MRTVARVANVRTWAITENINHRTAWMLLVLLGGYLFLDRAFAWIHVPGTPVFIGEVALLLGLIMVFRNQRALRFIRFSPPMQTLILFMGFGTVLLVFGFMEDGIDAIRDSSIWYYGLFAVVVATLLVAWQPAYGLFISNYEKALGWFIAIGTLRLILANRFEQFMMPDSEVPLTAHKPGNLGIQAAIAVLFVIVVMGDRQQERSERISARMLGVGGLVLVALAGTQNRGALVSAFIVFGLLVFVFRRARPFLSGAAVLLVGAIILAFSLDVSFQLARREVSVGQLLSNITQLSVTATHDAETPDDGTVAWRLALWDLVLDDTVSPERFLSGFGFGSNLAGAYGFIAGGEFGPELRNPHNSHLSVIARMGLIGAGLWVALWAVWYRQLYISYRRFTMLQEERKAAVIMWLMLATMAILLNGIFDPSLEGPQAAAWLWSMYGVGSVLAVEAKLPHRIQETEEVAEQETP